MKKALPYIIPVAICLAMGATAGWLQSASIADWYPYLAKPAMTPPNGIFPIVWTVLYLLSGVSAGLVWNNGGQARKNLLGLWGVQQGLNFTWSLVFFRMQNPLAGLLNILLLDLLVVRYAVRVWPVNRAASALFWPYAAWLAFATYLNLYIYLYN